jgi:hypothetical protein
MPPALAETAEFKVPSDETAQMPGLPYATAAMEDAGLRCLAAFAAA